ncbi:MAG: histidine phosphatase family protein [Pseudomonadota bacterium]
MKNGGNTALDGARRRRLYLFRHGAVDYVDAAGNWVADPDAVRLNSRGETQARAMAQAFAHVAVDKALCSGLPRTRQTADIVLADRGLKLGVVAGLEEIRPVRAEAAPNFDLLNDVAYTHWRAGDPEARFLGGERYADFYARVVESIEAILADQSWSSLAVFAHGGTNLALLGWASGLGKAAFGAFDQQTCCLNVIDFDTCAASGAMRRSTIRALNATAEDPLKHERRAGDLELLAGFLQRANS